MRLSRSPTIVMISYNAKRAICVLFILSVDVVWSRKVLKIAVPNGNVRIATFFDNVIVPPAKRIRQSKPAPFFERDTTVTKACGRTGDGVVDSFGLSAQFRAPGRSKRYTDESDLDEWVIDFEGRSFRESKRTDTLRNGGDSPSTRFCWQVLISGTAANGQRQTCGGVIIGSRTILTVAQCLLDTTTRIPLRISSMQVTVGAVNRDAPDSNGQDPIGCAQTFPVESAALHPNYNDGTNDNDLAVVTLIGAIDIDHKPCACTLCLKIREPTIGEQCVTAGFGADPEAGDRSTTLESVFQTVVSQANTTICPVFQDVASGAMTNIDNFYCTNTERVGQRLCRGDQGSALVCFDPTTSSHYLAGLTSFVSPNCGHGLGGQNVKVANYIDWISSTAVSGDVWVSFDGSSNHGSRQSTSGEGCGVPGNGAADPFGIVSQFGSSRAFRPPVPGPSVHSQFSDNELFPSSRIIGGADAPSNSICWQAYLVVNLPDGSGALTCGATIIGARSILTTASCLLDLQFKPVSVDKMFVVVGAIDSNAPSSVDPTGCEQAYDIQTGLTHPGFVFETNDNDLAILTLTASIDLSNKACACTACLTDRVPATAERCIMSGYGYETSDQSTPREPIPLKWVIQTIQPQNSGAAGACPTFTDGAKSTNLTGFICSSGAMGQDQCLGDLGGPLTCYNPTTKSYYAAGIISIPPETCGLGLRGQSVKLTNYLQWIADNTLAGDVLIGSASVVTKPPPTTVATTTPVTTVTTTADTTTTIVTTVEPTTTVTTTESTTAPTAPTTTDTTTVTTTTPTTTTTTTTVPLTTTTPPLVTILPPPGPKRCGLPGNNAADPFGIVSQFPASALRQRLPGRLAFNPASRRQSAGMLVNMKRPTGRIIGGLDAPSHEICWQALIVANLSTGEQTSCGGILIGARSVLTTASCVIDANQVKIPPTQMTVQVGALDSASPASNAEDLTGCAQGYTILDVIVHPQYDFATNDNDIALIVLAEIIDIANKACACTLCLTDRVPTVGEVCIMSGYGFETANQTLPRNPTPLKWVKQTIQEQNSLTSGSCPTFTSSSGDQTNVNSLLCTAGAIGQDQCLGDSGGPLACYNPTTSSYYAAGIISMQPKTCGTGEKGQSVSLVHYLPWIVASDLVEDIFINVTATTTPAPTTTVTTTTMPTTTTTTAEVTTTEPITTTAPTTTITTTSEATTQTTTEQTTPTTTETTTLPATTTPEGPGLSCGKPGNGVLDPFNLSAQFDANGQLKGGSSRVTFFQKGGKVVGGIKADARLICWQVLVIGLLGNGEEQYCGGVIVGSQTIITAAHCTFDDNGDPFSVSQMYVVAGTNAFPQSFDSSGCAIRLNLRAIRANSGFDADNLNNDIAVLVLQTPLNFASSSCYCPICLTNKLPVAGETCVVSGYGEQTTDSSAPNPPFVNLSWLRLKIRAQSKDGSCETFVDPGNGQPSDVNDFICAGGQEGEDTCHGDSGGPLFCYDPIVKRHYVAGLTSYGSDPCGTTTGSQYTRVLNYFSFITANTITGDVVIQTQSTSVATTPTTPATVTVTDSTNPTTTIEGQVTPTTITTESTTTATTVTTSTGATTSKAPSSLAYYNSNSRNGNRRGGFGFG